MHGTATGLDVHFIVEVQGASFYLYTVRYGSPGTLGSDIHSLIDHRSEPKLFESTIWLLLNVPKETSFRYMYLVWGQNECNIRLD